MARHVFFYPFSSFFAIHCHVNAHCRRKITRKKMKITWDECLKMEWTILNCSRIKSKVWKTKTNELRIYKMIDEFIELHWLKRLTI